MEDRRTLPALTVGYSLLLLYASLYPFGPWRWPPGLDWPWPWQLPWPRYWPVFDEVTNLLGYVPLGMGLWWAWRRALGWWGAAGLAVIVASALSYGVECAQYMLPGRVPSRSDWLLNTAGASLGVLLAASASRTLPLWRWRSALDRVVWPAHRRGLVLIALWPLALLYPLPLPFGVGQFFPLAQEHLAQLWPEGVMPPSPQALSPAASWVGTCLGVLAPMLLGLALLRGRRWRVIWPFVIAAVGLASAGMASALNTSSLHAWAWLTGGVQAAVVVALVLGSVAAWWSQRACAAWGLVVMGGLLAVVSAAPADPYLAWSLSAWEHSRYIHYHGLAQWLGWLWPVVSLAWLLRRVLSRPSLGSPE